MYRQGDLLIVPATIPDWVTSDLRHLISDGVVERGEATGHAHRLVGGEVWDGAGGGADIHLRAFASTQLVHEEHDTIVLPEGEYRVIRQREFSTEGNWSYVND